MLSRKQVIVIMSIAVVSFLFGTMFNFTTTVTGDSGSPWDRVWTRMDEIQSRVEILEEQSLPQGFVKAPAYDSGWTTISAITRKVTLTHNLGTTEVFVYIMGRQFRADSIHQWHDGDDVGYWYDLDISQITISGRKGSMWDQVRVMIWKIPETST